MLWEKPILTVGREKGDDMVYTKMRYPKRKGMTEIIAFFKKQSEILL